MEALQSIRTRLYTALDEYANVCLSLSNNQELMLGISDLAGDIIAEVEGFTYLKLKTTQVETILKKTRNSLRSLVSISSLPDETLARIFHFVHDVQFLQFERLVDNHSVPVNSLAVSQVCTRWRQVALSTGSLWSHIDLTACVKSISLGEIFATRSGNLPLHIRVVEPFTYNDRQIGRFRDTSKFEYFMLNIGPRVRSLEFSWIPQTCYLFLSWFELLDFSLYCSSQTLTCLVLSDRNVNTNRVVSDEYCSRLRWFLTTDAIPADDLNAFPNRIIVGSHPPHHYEDILSHIKSLKLDSVYPFWTSKAYHGLTELRLTGPRQLTKIITTQQLAGILQSSPDLHVFHFGPEVSPTLPSPPSVRLQHLEVFLLQSLTFDTQQAVLRLISPGTKPLQMSTTYNDMVQSYLAISPEDEFNRFFKRSNIVQLQVHSSVKVEPRAFLELLPGLQSLIFRNATILEAGSSQERRAIDICPNLCSLDFVSCTISLDAFAWLVSERRMSRVSMWDSVIAYEFETFDPYNFTDTLTEFCPVLQLFEIYEQTIKIEGWGEDIEDRIIRAQKCRYETH
ncbi:hypothetical protein RSOLAG1IB_04364 [Rhizoctonia solani AG-1 IB]|uniref:F-box domain-containing protein n=1 Tax=Thanatephorus cucumeris (strain AG1-IB / isolate 7/3/14) TaxID=1108050 RepID=A0A0B7FXP1_THACB|nr:hypothetical protein RSOLAG1IB_04364 [Rhizoctonia solani AG-1 IB]